MLPQPPPNAPAPPPSEAAMRSRRWLAWIVGVGVVSILALVTLAPLTLRSRKMADRTEAVSNARQIGLALFEFDATYGRFPDATTIPAVSTAYPGRGIPMGTRSSNDFFRQLIASDIVQTEALFYAKTATGKKPDNLFSGTDALQKRECAFGYIAGLSSSGFPPETPIVMVPLIPGKRQFDYKTARKYYGGKAVVLRIDNSVTTFPIDKSGRVWIHGRDLFDPSQPFWGGKTPDVKWPE